MSDVMAVSAPATTDQWEYIRASYRDLLEERSGQLYRLETPRPISDWHEDDGPVLCWKLPIDEPPYVGSPLDSDWPGYHTHWTPLPAANEPR